MEGGKSPPHIIWEPIFVILQFKEYQIVLEPKPDIKEIYIELTNACNLSCSHCYRLSWNAKTSFMERIIWQKILEDAKRCAYLERIVLGGIGEPLLHPDFIEILENTKKLNIRVSVTTNGFLLSEDICKRLVDFNIDEIVVSIDAYESETFFEKRGEDINTLWDRLRRLKEIKSSQRKICPDIKAEMVLDRENATDIFKLIPKLLQFDIKTLYISQLIPVNEKMLSKVFYEKYPNEKALHWKKEVTRASMYAGVKVLLPEMGLNTHRFCRFVEGKKVVIRFDGEVSPCYRFLHNSKEFVFGRPKNIHSISFGNVLNEGLGDIWTKGKFIKFRFLEHMNFYPSCPDCEWADGCDMVWDIEEDCWGNKPSCADCLWARGLIFCP